MHNTRETHGVGLRLSAPRKDGTTFPVEISLSSIEDESGSLLVLAAVRDRFFVELCLVSRRTGSVSIGSRTP